MAGLSDSFTKLVLKIGENVVSRRNDFTPPSTPTTTHSGPIIERPGSPFIMLDEGEEGEVEFEYKQADQSNNSTSEQFALQENYILPILSKENEESKEEKLFEIRGEEEIYETESEDDEAAMLEIDELRSHRSNPVTKDQFEACFDECGRLIQEHELRKQIFKGGVEDSIRKNVWKFLFELYPCNSTAREREILQVENIVRYEAMKIRWKDILKNLDIDHEYEGVRYCPKWYGACPDGSKNLLNSPTFSPKLQSSTNNDLVDYQNTKDVSNNILEEDRNAEYSIDCQGITPTDLNNEDIDNISKALADAMLESDKSSSLCNKDRLDLRLTEPLFADLKSPRSPRLFSDNVLVDYSDTEDIPEIPEHELFDNKVFPNPFMLSPEYVNRKESLYSMSENIASLDLDLMISKIALESDGQVDNSKLNFENASLNGTCEKSEGADLFLLNKTNDQSSKQSFCPIEMDDYYNKEQDEYTTDTIHSQCNGDDDLPLLNTTRTATMTITANTDEIHITTTEDADENPFVETTLNDKNGETTDIPVFQLDDIDGDEEQQNDCLVSGNQYISLNNNSQFGNESGEDNDNKEKDTGLETETPSTNFLSIAIENNHRRESLNTTEFCSHVQMRKTSRDDDSLEKRYIARSPTGETLEKLPPWIAQMIRVSTPTSPRERKEKQFLDTDLEECLCQITREELELKKEQIELNKELLGIVENANKFVQENLKAHSGRSTPKGLLYTDTSHLTLSESNDITPIQNDSINTLRSTPIKVHYSIYEGSESSFLSPLSNSEANVFIHKTPSLKLVTEENTDNTDSGIRLKLPTAEKCPYCSFEPGTTTKVVLPLSLGEEQLKFMEIQAQVFAARQPYSKKRVTESVRVIDKDIPRTDRELDMFSSCDDPGLLMLRDTLLTYAFFHPEVGYAQGMNDIMARFLYVMNNEADAYWMFSRYMEHFKNDFMEEGMLVKIAQVEQLLMKMDRELYDFLQSTDMGLIFCHRWLLLNFKREFEYNEAVRLFEITSSRHLEVSSLSAIIERSKERAKEFVKDSAGSHMEEVFLLPEYPFDIFLCVTMLMECRDMIMGDDDITMVYQILSNLPKTLDLQSILRRSEELFYRYCRKTTVDCFQVIDEVYEIPVSKNKRISFPFSFR